MQVGSGVSIEYIALDELPGGMPVAIVERGTEACVYLSRAYSVDEIAHALTATVNHYVGKTWVHMGAIAARL